MRGTLKAEGNALILDAQSKEDDPYSCSSCGGKPWVEVGYVDIGCISLVREAGVECVKQRGYARLRPVGRTWTGMIAWNSYWNTYEHLDGLKNRVTGFTKKPEQIPITIQK